MTPINLRLQLTPDAMVRLTTLVVPNSKFTNFVRVKSVRHAGEVYEVDLNILDAYHVVDLNVVDSKKQVTVTREMVGELFDLLGIFPRAKTLPEEIRAPIQNIKEMINTLYSSRSQESDLWSEVEGTMSSIKVDLECLERHLTSRL